MKGTPEDKVVLALLAGMLSYLGQRDASGCVWTALGCAYAEQDTAHPRIHSQALLIAAHDRINQYMEEKLGEHITFAQWLFVNDREYGELLKRHDSDRTPYSFRRIVQYRSRARVQWVQYMVDQTTKALNGQEID